MGVKVILRRDNGASPGHKSYGQETRTFEYADEWDFGETDTLLIMNNSEEEGKFIAEFPVDVVESVEFV